MNVRESSLTFNDFCYKSLDRMYEPRLSYEQQLNNLK